MEITLESSVLGEMQYKHTRPNIFLILTSSFPVYATNLIKYNTTFKLLRRSYRSS